MSAHHEQILGFLSELDGLLHPSKPLSVYLIGGGAITLAYDSQNRTADLDLIEPEAILVTKGGDKSALAKKYHVYISYLDEINFAVPKDWRAHCQLLDLKLIHLKVYVACVEDIVLGKVARLEPKDFEDIISLHESGVLKVPALLKRLKQNKQELRTTEYRQNARLLFKEVFRKELQFANGEVSLK